MACKGMGTDSCLRKNQRGIALLLVLWIITLLAVICAEFSATMRTETHVAHNFRESEQAYYSAEAAINRAILEIMRTSHSVSSRSAASAANPNNPDTGDESETGYWRAGGSYSFTIDDELRCQVEIEDEGNKADINALLQDAKKNPEPLKQLLRKKIGLKGDDVDIVADSLIDWRDSDNNITGTNGAEDDYYKRLDPPYLCRNGTIPVIEELLLVRGIDDRILFGKRGRPEQKIELSQEDLDDILNGRAGQQENPDLDIPEGNDDEAGIQHLGLIDIFSAPPANFGTGAKVNAKGDIILDMNSATVQQMLVLTGMTPETASEIVQERNKHLFASTADRLPSFKNYFRWKDSITVSPQGSLSQKVLRINARGCAPDGIVCRRITCTVLFARNRFFFLSWKEKN
jgi:type II secretory pathway component PulK